MKAMKAGKKVMNKSALAEAIAGQADLKRAVVGKMLGSLAAIAARELKNKGKFVLPGLFMVKTRVKAARKAGKRMAFGKEVQVKAAPATTVVKAFCVKALKESV